MVKTSAGLLMYKKKEGAIKVFLVHPGGPFWKDKDKGVWSIPKGEVEEGEKEDMLIAAMREMKEETGIDAPKERERYSYLGKIKQKAGKIVHCWTFEGDWTGLLMGKSYMTMEIPARSGKFVKFPEVDKAGFFGIEEAKEKINQAQVEFLDKLVSLTL